ncbi:MAG: putative Na+/H+ antiporter [Puniceicoccales bacterium]|jgi:hypothetical protein|nr:putative Na+/H+ antiporter [Puniceicoccales bacterium]
MKRLFLIPIIFAFAITGTAFCSGATISLPLSLSSYEAMEFGKDLSLAQVLLGRVSASPFNLVATVIFFLAIIHTFFTGKISKYAQQLQQNFSAKLENRGKVCFFSEICHLFGETEIVFGLWCVPLIAAIAHNFGWAGVTSYFNDSVNFAEPIFVIVIMSMASTRPIIVLAESALGRIARIGNYSPSAWWLAILILSPLMGSLITEPAAMTIGAMLLAKKFYHLSPSNTLKYATLALLFVNVSVGGTLTHFAAPPVLMVARKWSLGLGEMFLQFGIRACLGIILSTVLYFLLLRKEFKKMPSERLAGGNSGEIPPRVTLAHIAFMAWTVSVFRTPALVMGGYLFWLGFTQATRHYQVEFSIKNPLLVGFFLAGLIIHGGFQAWWLSPILSALGERSLFFGATILTAFNDNAAITYLASLVPVFAANRALQKAVLAGAVTGGGLTVIANAPNPAGQSILAEYFSGAISPIKLFLGAILPTIIVAMCFTLF